jgi:hypothetical protein
MATTTNYGWDTPDDTDLVKDGAAAIRTLGSSIDTTTKNLNPQTTTGAIAYRSATANVNTALPLGTANQVLRVNSGGTAPEWATTADQTPLTTKGDLFGFDTADARIPIGTNGHILTADSTQSLGLKWAAPAATDSFTLIASGTLSSSGPSFTSIPATYKYLVLNINNVQVSTGAAIGPRINNITTASLHRTYGFNSNGASITNGTAADTFFTLSQGGNLDTGSNENNFVIYFPNYYSTTGKTIINYVGYWKAFGVPIASTGGGYLNDTAAAVNRIDFITGAGTFSGGTYELFGVK